MRKGFVPLLICPLISGVGYCENADVLLKCLSHEKNQCGCALSVRDQGCGAQGSVNFFSELSSGSPLWMATDKGDLQLNSAKVVTDPSGFPFSRGARWSETYIGEGLSVIIDYRPGVDTCPKPKGEEDCEYFDVEATVYVKGNSVQHTYQASGTCGC